jgi:3-hydroxyisobutyrate dehydrogenase
MWRVTVEGRGQLQHPRRKRRSGQDAVITMLPNGEILRSVYAEIVPAGTKGSVFIDCSTVDVDSARAAHEMAAANGLLSVDAPVSGGVGGASAGTLTFMAGGSDEAFRAPRRCSRSWVRRRCIAARPVLANRPRSATTCCSASR